MKKIMFAAVLFFSGCAHSSLDTDVSNLDPGCVRECSKTYSQCTSGANQFGDFGQVSVRLRECSENRKACVKECPQIEPKDQGLR